MNLYFLDNEDKQHLVAENVTESQAIDLINIDLVTRKPNFRSYYSRMWWDKNDRMWIDFGSHTEFYLLQDAVKAMNVVEDPVEDECDTCKIDISEGDENSEQ